jgi:putative FmdB family regulatory protein
MPTYVYECEKCGELELEQSIKDPVLTCCPKCGGKVRRIIAGGTSFVLKGGGWASSGYASASCRRASASSGQDRR